MSRIRTKNIYLLGTICALTLAQNAFAIGIGTSINTLLDVSTQSLSSSTIYIPIMTKGTLLVEPFVSRTNSKSKNSFGDSTTIQQTIGIGFFAVNKIDQDLSRYLGARIGHSTAKQSSTGSSTSKTTLTSVTPIIGLDYSINKHVFIALEAGITFIDGEDKSGSNTIDESGDVTFAQLMARYYF